MIPRTLLRLASAAAMAGCMVGCSSPKLNLWKPQVRESFAAAPQSYQRVAIAPIVLVVRGNLDETLRLEELGRVRTRVATNIVVGLKDSLEHRGYQMVNVPPVLAVAEDWEQFDADTRDLVQGVQRELLHISDALVLKEENQRKAERSSSAARGQSPPAAPPPEVKITTTERFSPRLADLIDRLGLKDVPAVVLLHETAYVESGKDAARRRRGNMAAHIGGGWVYGSPEGFIHRLALVDTRTLAILWMRVKPTNVRPYNDFESTDAFHVFLKDLPSLAAPKDQ